MKATLETKRPSHESKKERPETKFESTTRMKPQYEYRVGFFVFVAFIMLLYGWGWLKGLSILHPPQRILVQFHDVAGLNANATVNINGVRVGVVDKLDLRGKGDVLCLLKINTESVTIPKGSKFTIQTLGLVGAKYVEITLPETKEGEQPPPPIESDSIVVGEDPVRVELVVNKIATNLSKVDYSAVGERLTHDLERFGVAADSVQKAADQFGTVADNAKGASGEAKTFFQKGTKSMDEIHSLAASLKANGNKAGGAFDSMRLAFNNVNHKLNNPAMTGDLKEVADKAFQAADKINSAMQSLTATLGDQPVRTDLLKILDKLNTTTENIYKSVNGAKEVASDQALRSDLKDALANFKDAMDKVDNIVSKPGMEADIKSTLTKVKSAAGNVDHAAQQVTQVLNKKHPLMQMMFGQPGYIKQDTKEVTSKSGAENPSDKDKPKSGGDVPQEQQPRIETHDSTSSPAEAPKPAP